MRSAFKLFCLLLAVFAIVGLAASAYFLLSYGLPPEVLRPILSVCLILTVGYAVRSNDAILTKRYTTATGVG